MPIDNTKDEQKPVIKTRDVPGPKDVRTLTNQPPVKRRDINLPLESATCTSTGY